MKMFGSSYRYSTPGLLQTFSNSLAVSHWEEPDLFSLQTKKEVNFFLRNFLTRLFDIHPLIQFYDAKLITKCIKWKWFFLKFRNDNLRNAQFGPRCADAFFQQTYSPHSIPCMYKQCGMISEDHDLLQAYNHSTINYSNVLFPFDDEISVGDFCFGKVV